MRSLLSVQALHTAQKNVLFEGVGSDMLPPLLESLGCYEKKHPKDSFVWLQGDTTNHMGIILGGTVHVLKEDYMGARQIVAVLKWGDVFGEAFLCAGVKESPVTVLAVSETTVLYICYDNIFKQKKDPSGALFIENLLRLIAQKNLYLNDKLELMGCRSIREKILTYLNKVQKQNGGKSTFPIPMNRTQLADYLGTDRSALSRELSKLQKEGVIEFDKNNFTVKQY